MKILMASTPATGHINPLLAIGNVLMAQLRLEQYGLVCGNLARNYGRLVS
jgi:hypothetical protein